MDARRESEPIPMNNRTTVERKSERELVVTRTFIRGERPCGQNAHASAHQSATSPSAADCTWPAAGAGSTGTPSLGVLARSVRAAARLT